MVKRACCLLYNLFQILIVGIYSWEPDTCQEVTAESQQFTKDRLLVKDGAGNPAIVNGVSLLEQTSPETPCVHWDNFGHQEFSLSVENGCEGRFNVCYVSGIRPPEIPVTKNTECTTVRLLSRTRIADEKLITPYVSGGNLIVSMELLRQFSLVSCVKGLSFNYYDQRVESRFGCRGDFRVCVDTLIVLDNIIPDIKCQKFIMRSKAGREEKITVPLTYGGIISMVVVNEYSNKVCFLGKTFGFTQKHGLDIYAKNGCQAEFDVCQSPDDLLPPRERWETI